jgi:hypothetical protein
MEVIQPVETVESKQAENEPIPVETEVIRPVEEIFNEWHAT